MKVLTDDSTRKGDKPILIFEEILFLVFGYRLKRIEKSQCSSHSADQIVNCLLRSTISSSCFKK